MKIKSEWHTSAPTWGALIVSWEENPEMQKSYCLEISQQETGGGLIFGSPQIPQVLLTEVRYGSCIMTSLGLATAIKNSRGLWGLGDDGFLFEITQHIWLLWHLIKVYSTNHHISFNEIWWKWQMCLIFPLFIDMLHPVKSFIWLSMFYNQSGT